MHSEKLGGNRGNLGTTIGKRLQKLAHNILTFFYLHKNHPIHQRYPLPPSFPPDHIPKEFLG